MSRPLAGAILLFSLGCASWPSPSPPLVPVATDMTANAVTGKTIQVEEFVLDTRVERYEGPEDWLGVELAQKLANELRRAGVQATPVLPGAGGGADVVVRGRIVLADGGSRTARMWAGGYGAGPARLQIAGRAVGADGSLLGRFSRERRSGRTPDSVAVMELCIDALARDVAGMIIRNDYREQVQ